jgi:predicted nucleic acid-binding protein
MATLVADASALAAVLFAEPEAERVASSLEGHSLAAPTLLPFELANVAVVKVRRGRTSRALVRAGFESLRRLRISLHDVDAEGAFALAAETGLSAYDAAYLWVALALDADLLTLDRQLAEAFRGLR